MVKRRFYFYGFLLVLFLGIISPREVGAETGTCTCSVNNGRMLFVASDNCFPATEYAKCGGGQSGPATCECIKKENSELPANTCQCTGGGVITASSCQGDTPRENCVTRGAYCYCSAETSNATDAVLAPRPNTPEAEAANAAKSAGSVGSCINTALGCVPYTVNGFSTWLLQILFGIAGGIAFLLMVYGFILIATSSGDEKKVQAAKETITSAITGLLVSIFALFLFRLIAVDILKIPGISGSGSSTSKVGTDENGNGGSTIFTTEDGTVHGGRGGSF